MESIPHKRGDTFLLTCTTDVPLTGYVIASQVAVSVKQIGTVGTSGTIANYIQLMYSWE